MSKVLENISQLATCRAEGAQGDIHAIADAALVWAESEIVWVGARNDLPSEYRRADRLDAGGGLVTPGLVDCHTHLAFGGWRADEFEQRIRGKSYLDIAREGGGIARTVRLTRESSEVALLARARGFLEEMRTLGVTTVECKSGYGLDRENELKLLRVYRDLAGEGIARIVPTYLGAHVVPPEFRADRERYLRLMEGLIPEIAAESLAQVLRRLRRGFRLQPGRGPSRSAGREGGRAWPSSSTPTSSLRAEARSSPPSWAPCPPTTWSRRRRPGSRRWRGQAPWP